MVLRQMANVNRLRGLFSHISRKDGFLIGKAIPDREQIFGLGMRVGLSGR